MLEEFWEFDRKLIHEKYESAPRAEKGMSVAIIGSITVT
jgi:hypothetical protein